MINTEILAKAERAGATWIEVGVNHYPRPAGESSGGSPRVVFRAMKETIALWLRLRDYTPPVGVTSGDPPSHRVANGLAGVVGGIVGALTAVTVMLRRGRR